MTIGGQYFCMLWSVPIKSVNPLLTFVRLTSTLPTRRLLHTIFLFKELSFNKGKRNLYDHPKLEHLQPLPFKCFTKIRRFWETVKYLKNFFLNFLTLILTPPTLNGTGLKSVFQRTIRITRLDFKDNKNFLVRQIF